MNDLELHVFHYAGHSAVWSLHTRPTNGHGAQPTRDGDYIDREYRVFPSRLNADAYVGDILEVDEQRDLDVKPVRVFHHTVTANNIAVPVQADDPENQRTLRGWLIYGPDGKYQQIIDEYSDGKAALDKAGVTVVLTEPIKLTPRQYLDLTSPF